MLSPLVSVAEDTAVPFNSLGSGSRSGGPIVKVDWVAPEDVDSGRSVVSVMAGCSGMTRDSSVKRGGGKAGREG